MHAAADHDVGPGEGRAGVVAGLRLAHGDAVAVLRGEVVQGGAVFVAGRVVEHVGEQRHLAPVGEQRIDDAPHAAAIALGVDVRPAVPQQPGHVEDDVERGGLGCAGTVGSGWAGGWGRAKTTSVAVRVGARPRLVA